MSPSEYLKNMHRQNRKKIQAIPKPCPEDDLSLAAESKVANLAKDASFIIESRNKARMEDRKRWRRHKSSGGTFLKTHRDVGWHNKLIGSLASARFCHEMRWRVGGEGLRLLRQQASKPACTATIVNPNWIFKTEDIAGINFAKIKRQFKTQLKRTGVTAASGFMIGNFDADFDGKNLRVHIHAWASGNKVKALKNLRQISCYQSCEAVDKPLVFKPIKDPRSQISYCMKSYWRRNVYYLNDDGALTKSTQRRRLPHDVEALCLQKLHETRVTDILLLNGVRLGKSGFQFSNRLSPKLKRRDRSNDQTAAKISINTLNQKGRNS